MNKIEPVVEFSTGTVKKTVRICKTKTSTTYIKVAEVNFCKYLSMENRPRL